MSKSHTFMRALSMLLQRRAWNPGITYDGKRDMYAALGYLGKITTSHYRKRYERGGIATRIVEAFPKAVWSGEVYIVEDPDPSKLTNFEKEASLLAVRLGLWQRMQRAHILANLGEYAIIVIGAPGDMQSMLPTTLEASEVLYLTPVGQDKADIKTIEVDPNSPRFGLPLTYSVKFADESVLGNKIPTDLGTKTVHWSRVIHVVNGNLESEIYGKPALQSVWNDLDNLEKIIGGGAEATWRRVNRHTLFDLDPELEFDSEDETKMQEELEEVMHGFRSFARTRGITPHDLTGDVPEFAPNAKAVLEVIAATTEIPQRILMGSERGELASTQDRDNWSGRVDAERSRFGVPLVRQFFDRLIEHGALPAPKEYIIDWAKEDKLTEDEKSNIVARVATANKAQVEAGYHPILTPSEIRNRVYRLGAVQDKLPKEQVQPAASSDNNDTEDSLPDNVDDAQNDVVSVNTNAAKHTALKLFMRKFA